MQVLVVQTNEKKIFEKKKIGGKFENLILKMEKKRKWSV
jgi:hypothetical protein